MNRACEFNEVNFPGLKHTAHPTHEFARRTVLDVGSYKRYTEIDKKFELLKKSLN